VKFCYLAERHYHVIPSGLDVELFRPMPQTEARRRVGLPLDKHLILFVGNPERPEKRYDLARAALAMLHNQLIVELVVVNDIPHAVIPYYMNACDALLLTSSHEGSRNVVKEALACNLPVVSVDVGDVRQRIGCIEACVLGADDLPETIAAGLAQVLSRRTRINGRRTVRDLDEKRLAERVIAVYEQAISKA
jgi:teichuronic acid biosynthesis glycosyltransferase TuaC